MTDRSKQRAETAKRHDDSDIIDAADEQATPEAEGTAGGNMARAVGTRDEAKRVEQPEASTGVDKGDERADVKPNETSAT